MGWSVARIRAGAETVFRARAEQLSLSFAPRTADELLARLTTYGMRGVTSLRLTRNRTVMVSFRGGAVRVHRSFLDAPERVLRAVAAFVSARTRAERTSARQTLLAWPGPRREESPPPRRREPRYPEDAPAEARLAEAHRLLNVERFDGVLSPLTIRLSRRLKSRLGYYRLASGGESPEIAISRRHLRRHGWREAVATLLHEMVHQWQDECGLPVDHGRRFRDKARAVGVIPAARRPVT